MTRVRLEDKLQIRSFAAGLAIAVAAGVTGITLLIRVALPAIAPAVLSFLAW